MVQLGKWNTLRNQIFLGFVLVMCIILTLVGTFMFDRVSILLQNNVEKHIQQTAVQASGQLSALLKQIDMLTSQVATDAAIQSLLAKEVKGERISFNMRQKLQQEVRKYEAYATGIRSMELYTTDHRSLVPLLDIDLTNRVFDKWIQEANLAQGKLVWLGLDPLDSNTVIAMRQVRLMDDSFTHGGYVFIRIEKSYFALSDRTTTSGMDTQEKMGLFDKAGGTIFSTLDHGMKSNQMLEHNGDNIEIAGEQFILIKRHSVETGWPLVILTPVSYTTEGISVLRTGIIVSGLAGGILFLVLSFALSTMITRPILNLIKVMRGARFGNLKYNDSSPTTVELQELNYTYNQLVDHLNELIEVVYQKEIIQSRTELKALQAQINPHFLFNTLEAFYWALDEKGEEELAQIVIAMSDLFRYVINKTEDDVWVTIGEELDHAARYLKIMKMRMLDRLSWTIDINEEYRDVPLPKLLVQPLVENAILHGVEQRYEQGMVQIEVKSSSRQGYILITISDNGPGMSSAMLDSIHFALREGYVSSPKGNGVGIVNVERRLRLYYGDKTEGLIIHSEEEQGTTISFEIPMT
ncbi:sensor histidine kinase [Paenibacillus turicensis]|uniref:sensor histidine kinase n=1 Tax=Paenibacillus turicensis TaxID=160487 RepID=UPI003D2869AA